MGVMALIAAEFIPVSLLTPIARDLAVSEGMAGQTVTAVGVLAVLTSLLLAPLTGNTDRRRILLAFSAMLVASYMLIGMAPTYSIMLIGRAILGICVGGFWSLASAVTPAAPVHEGRPPRPEHRLRRGFRSDDHSPARGELDRPSDRLAKCLFSRRARGAVFVWQYRALPLPPGPRGRLRFRDMSALLRRIFGG